MKLRRFESSNLKKVIMGLTTKEVINDTNGHGQKLLDKEDCGE